MICISRRKPSYFALENASLGSEKPHTVSPFYELHTRCPKEWYSEAEHRAWSQTGLGLNPGSYRMLLYSLGLIFVSDK